MANLFAEKSTRVYRSVVEGPPRVFLVCLGVVMNRAPVTHKKFLAFSDNL